MRNQKIVVGLIGEKGSGKETVGNLIMELLPKKKIVRVRSSDILGETLYLWNISSNRRNLQHLAIVMDEGFGKGTLSTAVRHRIDSITADIIIFDGMRWQTDFDLVRSFEKNFVVYVTADLETRYERIKKRKEKTGEHGVSFEQFMDEEKVGTETQVPILAQNADIILKNDGDIEELQPKIKEKFVDTKLLFL